MRSYYFSQCHQHHSQQWLSQRLLQHQSLLRTRNGSSVSRQLLQQQLLQYPPCSSELPQQPSHRCFVTSTGIFTSTMKSDASLGSDLLMRRNRKPTLDMCLLYHPLLRNRYHQRPHHMTSPLFYVSSSFSSSSSSNRVHPSGSDPMLPSTSSMYDPKTNEPAGLRVVIEGMKRMETQMSKMESDIDAIKSIVKKIRESNGKTEERLDVIEDYADTMQQDLYFATDMVRVLIEEIAPKDDEDDDDTSSATPKHTIRKDPNPQSAAAAKARAIREQYHSRKNATTTTDDDNHDHERDTNDNERTLSRK